MAYAKRRSNGKFSAIYLDHTGKERSAGTFASEEQAKEVAETQELYVRTGRTGVDPARKATITIAEYAPGWLRNHRVEPSTKTGYDAVIKAHIIPAFGSTRVVELQREQVRSYITTLQERGASVSLQRLVRAVLSAMMQTAWDDGYREGNPIRGLSVQRGSRKKIVVLTTEQFGDVYRALPSDGAQILADLIVSTGCRTAEAFALCVEQYDAEKFSLHFDRSLQIVKKEFHPTGDSRFHVAPYTKDHGQRTVTIPKKLAVALDNWIVTNDLGPGDLLFPRALVVAERRKRRVRIDLTEELLATLGSVVGPNGKEYRHGTVNGYVTGKCKCDYCKQALADYRWERDQAKGGSGKHTSNPTVADRRPERVDPFLDRHDWRKVWKKAVTEADLPFMPTAYQLRHTHASWLIEKGVDPKRVMTRLGHTDLSTTSLYVHEVHGDEDRQVADLMDDLGDW